MTDPVNVAPTGDGDNDDLHSVAGSERSMASSRSGIPTRSGSRLPPPPAKTSRPCVGRQPAKAPIPASPKQMLSAHDYGHRYKLSDVVETEEYEEDFFGNRLHSSFTSTLPRNFRSAYRSPFEYIHDSSASDEDFYKDFSAPLFSSFLSGTSGRPPRGVLRERSRDRSPSLRRTSLGSAGTASSMDTLWESHPRRLSEAGLSRYSDTSTVLTEDTNSFIIGQRVFVGGTKPGQIAYIGETQFAPGEWAGIVLDQAIGKNDGSVAGVRYFQCEPKRGVFSRLTRLTRYPLGPDVRSSPSPTNGVRRSSPMSPTTSTRSPLSVSNTSLQVDFKVGDRVIIQSSQGSKVGTLRYIGITLFATGEWCGVELDEPRGKNDGSVAGERYFSCAPNYGLFAPVSKVSKSPSKRKPGNCVVHSSMRRTGSKESLLSLNSSLASASVASAAAARRVRLGVTSLTPKKPTPKTSSASTPLPSRTTLQDVLKEKQQHIEQLLKERDLERSEFTKASSLADEAERKFGEQQKDFENYRIESECKVKELLGIASRFEHENKELLIQLDEEKQKNEDWQFKYEETSITKTDFENLAKAQNSANEEFTTKVAAMDAQINQLQAQVELEGRKLLQSQEELVQARECNEVLKIQLEHANEKRSNLENGETKSIELVQTLQSQLEDAHSALKRQQEVFQTQVDELTAQISRSHSDHEVHTFKLNKAIEDAREKYMHDLNAKNAELQLLTCAYDEAKACRNNETKEYELFKYNAAQNESAAQKDANRLKMELSAKVLEIEAQHDAAKAHHVEVKRLEDALTKAQASLEVQIRATEHVNVEEEKSRLELTKMQEQLSNRDTEIALLRNKLETNTADSSKLIESFKTQCGQLRSELSAAHTDVAAKCAQTKLFEEKLDALQDELAKRCQSEERNRIELMHLQGKLQEAAEIIKHARGEESELKLHLGDAQRTAKLFEEKHMEAMKVRQKLELEIQHLLGSSGEESAKLDILHRELRTKQEEFDSCRHQFEEKVKTLEHALHETNINAANAKQAYQVQTAKYENDIKQLQSAQQQSNEVSAREIETINKTLAEVNEELKNKQNACNELMVNLQIELEAKTALESVVTECKLVEGQLVAQLENIDKENTQLKEAICQSSEELKQTQKLVDNTNFENTRLVSALQEDLHQRDCEIQQLLTRIEETDKLSSQKDVINAQNEEEIALLRRKHLELETSLDELRLDAEHCKKLLSDAQIEIQKVTNQYQGAVAQIGEKDRQLQEAHQHDAVILEKDNEINALQSKLDEMHKSHNSVAVQLDAARSNALQVQKELEGKTEELQQIWNVLQSKEQEGKDVNSNLLSKNEEICKLQSQLSDANEAMQQVHKQDERLRAELLHLNKQLDEQQCAIANETNKTRLLEGFVKQLKVTEQCKRDLLSSANVQQTEALSAIVDSLNVDDGRDKLQHLEKIVNESNEFVVAANATIQQQQTRINSLQQDLLKAKLERQMKQNSVQISDESVCNSNAMKSNDYKQLLAEKLEAESQIEFLHTIIADMQKKNEEQKARIEILESGYSPLDANELKLMGLVEKKIAPRLYCDICEEFDLHDTEDCPMQADEDMPSPPPDPARKDKPPPRPYCEICEAFVHNTADCPEEETY